MVTKFFPEVALGLHLVPGCPGTWDSTVAGNLILTRKANIIRQGQHH